VPVYARVGMSAPCAMLWFTFRRQVLHPASCLTAWVHLVWRALHVALLRNRGAAFGLLREMTALIAWPRPLALALPASDMCPFVNLRSLRRHLVLARSARC
jgi:lipoprotein signal peptidase